MYHFIRRCFVLVLVLAFGFSFLLCCFVPTSYCQSGWEDNLAYYDPWPNDLWPRTLDQSPLWGGLGKRITSTEQISIMSQPAINQFQLGGRIPYNGLMYSQPLGQFLFSGSTSSIMDRTGFAIGTSIQQYIPNSALRSYITGGAVTGAYGLPTTGTVNYRLPTVGPALQTYNWARLQPAPEFGGYSAHFEFKPGYSRWWDAY